MTYQESELYPSFEEFMREDKFPPIFPSSQSSTVSEAQVYSQHLISEACDRDTYGPFGNGQDEDELPPNFVNSSLAYSPKSIPPRSPSDGSSPFHTTSASSSTLDPMDVSTGDADEIIEAEAELSHGMSDDIVTVENAPLVDDEELMKLLGELPEFSKDFCQFSNEESHQVTSLSTSINIENIETPEVPSIKSEGSFPSSSTTTTTTTLTPSTSTSDFTIETETPKSEDQLDNQSSTPRDVKKPRTNGRKRKLFTNLGDKKKDQNKEAARRYREKKKSEDARLEIEEAKLKVRQSELRKELELVKRAHAEFMEIAKVMVQAKRKKI